MEFLTWVLGLLFDPREILAAYFTLSIIVIKVSKIIF